MFDLKDSKIKDKTEKLTSALYLVTGLISDQEPIKWQLREKSLRLLSDISRMVKQAEGFSKTVVLPDTLTDNLSEMITLFDLALASNLFSNMNFSILKREYQAVKQIVETGAKSELEVVVQPHPANQPHPLAPSPKERGNPPLRGGQGGARQDSILNFIRSHGASSIKEISASVPNVSSKTIQRELVELVNNGALKKEGDRRWSRYAVI
ncbi:MAG: DeoR family transcriptional regulator [Patescibacteria group bacterium]